MDTTPTHPDVIVEPKLLGPHSVDDLLAVYVEVDGDYQAFRAKLNLSGAQLLAFMEDKAITQRRLAVDAFLSLDKVRRNQDETAAGLKATMKTSTNPVECRRAAVALGILVRNWDCFDPASPTAPIKRTHPRGTAPGGTALQSGASGAPPRQPKPAPPPPPKEPLITREPQRGDHPIKAVSLALEVYQHPTTFRPHVTAEVLAVQLAAGATIDHKSVPPQAYLDPYTLAEFVKDSTLTDLAHTPQADFITLSKDQTTASLRMVLETKKDHILADITATRKDLKSTWFITSISSPHRPAPPPLRGGGVASPRSDGGGASEGPAPP